MTRPCTVYRAYSYSGCLLYVGSTVDLPARLREHRTSAWWRSCALVTTETFEDVEPARAAETAAIQAEKPALNLMGTGAGLSTLGGQPRIAPHVPVEPAVDSPALRVAELRAVRAEQETFLLGERLLDTQRELDEARKVLSEVADLLNARGLQ